MVLRCRAVFISHRHLVYVGHFASHLLVAEMFVRFPVLRVPRILCRASRRMIVSSSRLTPPSPYRSLTTRGETRQIHNAVLRTPPHTYCYKPFGVGSHRLGFWDSFAPVHRSSLLPTANFSAMALPRIQESQIVENEVSLTGMLCEEPQLDYTVDGLAYLEAVIEVKRGSGIGSDRVVLLLEPLEGNPGFAERAAMEAKLGTVVCVQGQMMNHLYDEDRKLTRPEVLVRHLAMVEGTKDFAKMPVEEKWEMFFRNPSDFWDNRFKKLNPRGPDFKLKDRDVDVALWIDSRTNPSGVVEKLADLMDRGLLPRAPQ